MTMRRSALCEGVSLNTVQTDRFKTAMLTVNLFVPLRKETASAYSLLTDVLMRGTRSYPTMQELNRKQDELYSLGLGAYVHKKGEAQAVTFELTCIEDAFAFDGMRVLEEGMKLLRELLFCPITENGCFLPSYVEQEKSNLIDDLRSRINNKASYARTRCIELMCEGEPYAVECGGSEEEVQKLTPQALWEAYTFLLANAYTEIVYVGSKEHAYVASLCKTYLPFADRKAALPEIQTASAPETYRVVREQMQVSQCKLSIGFRTELRSNMPDFKQLVVFNEVFGGSPNSRLFLNIREKQSLCYTCASHVQGLKGILMVNAGIEQKNEQTALDGIFAEWKRIANGELTEEELCLAKLSLRNGYREVTDSISSLSAWYLAHALIGSSTSPEETADALDQVTLADVVKAANRIHPDTVYYLEGGAL